MSACACVSLSLRALAYVCAVLRCAVLGWVRLGWVGLGWVVKDLSEMEVGLCMRNEALQLVVSIVSILPCALWTPTVANSRMALVLWVSSPFWSAALRCLLASLSHPFGQLPCAACLQVSVTLSVSCVALLACKGHKTPIPESFVTQKTGIDSNAYGQYLTCGDLIQLSSH